MNCYLWINLTLLRTKGDVLKIYLEILPTLKSCFTVYIHNILSPRNYLTNGFYKN